MRYRMVRDRAYRNMRAIRRRSKKEMYVKGIGEGLVFLLIGGAIMTLNVQKVGAVTLAVALQHLPLWVWIVGAGVGLFGLYWTLRNAWLLVLLVKARERINMPPDMSGTSRN
jgi:hypothetical protein